MSREARDAALRACRQPEFFGRAVPSIAAVATTPMDHVLAREVGVAREASAREAVENALCRAVKQRVQAQVREARIYFTLESPHVCAPLMACIRTAMAGVDVPELVSRSLAGERLPIIRRSIPVDYEADLRPRR